MQPKGRWWQIDFVGAIIAVFATTLLLGIVNGGTQHNWLTPDVLALFAIAIVSFAVFIWAELRALDPVVPLSLFGIRAVAAGTAMNFLTGFLLVSTILYAPLFAQAVLGNSPTAAGATLRRICWHSWAATRLLAGCWRALAATSR